MHFWKSGSVATLSPHSQTTINWRCIAGEGRGASAGHPLPSLLAIISTSPYCLTQKICITHSQYLPDP